MPISCEKMLKSHEEEVVRVVLLRGEFEAMSMFGLRDYMSFKKWYLYGAGHHSRLTGDSINRKAEHQHVRLKNSCS